MSSPTTTSASTSTSTSSSSGASATLDPVQQILHDLASPTFIIPIVIMAVTFITLCIFCCVYNCCGKAAARRRYIEYNAPSSHAWIPEIHVPEQFKQARAQEATVYRFG